jgi:hypothetical protein
MFESWNFVVHDCQHFIIALISPRVYCRLVSTPQLKFPLYLIISYDPIDLPLHDHSLKKQNQLLVYWSICKGYYANRSYSANYP